MKVLIAFPFSIYPVKSGGAQRGYNLLLELVRHHAVDALIIDQVSEVHDSITKDLGYEPNALRLKTIGSDHGHRGLRRKITDRITTGFLSRSITTSSNRIVLSICRTLGEMINLHQIDVAILSTQELAICGTLMRRLAPNLLRIVDLHNLDHLLVKQEMESKGPEKALRKSYQQVKRTESSLFRYSDGVFTCSDPDLSTVRKLNQEELTFGAVVPNGVRCSAIRFDRSPTKSSSIQFIFCGTLSYLPNVDALNWFHSEIWPVVKSSLSDSRLLVVGRGMDKKLFKDLISDSSVDLIGEVDDLEPWYNTAGISLCPLRIGSGTRLKILEAMAFGNPVVSTSIGCEGLSVNDGQHIVIRDTAKAFANALIDLARNQDDFDRIRYSARAHVEQLYDWEIIGAEISRTLMHWRRPESSSAE